MNLYGVFSLRALVKEDIEERISQIHFAWMPTKNTRYIGNSLLRLCQICAILFAIWGNLRQSQEIIYGRKNLLFKWFSWLFAKTPKLHQASVLVSLILRYLGADQVEVQWAALLQRTTSGPDRKAESDPFLPARGWALLCPRRDR